MVKGQPEAGAMQQHNLGLKGSIKSWQGNWNSGHGGGGQKPDEDAL